MERWTAFAAAAPQISEVFLRRHRATGNLCFLATLRADGYPRISPMEPRIFEDTLVLVGMPDTSKFRDLLRDPRFSLHTATVDTQVGDGDAKLWGRARAVDDHGVRDRFAEDLFATSGADFRGQRLPFFVADIEGASAVAFTDGQLTITTWSSGDEERTAPLG